MLTSDRQNEIIKIVNRSGSATVSELMSRFDASESTIRRDLIFLDKAGKLKKVHGGANSIKDSFFSVEYDMDTKSALNVGEKEIIGKYAASLINDDDFVFIDAGSSTMHMVDNIAPSKAVFVTNGIAHAKKLTKKGLKVFVIGGELKLSTEAIIGIEAVSGIQKYNFTKAFIGTNGISVTRGLTTPDVEEAMLKSRVCELSYVTFVLADSTKFGVTSSVTFADIKNVCLITEKPAGSEFTDATIVKVAPQEF
jgi:DeoR family fructose operon transcriptional repressor